MPKHRLVGVADACGHDRCGGQARHHQSLRPPTPSSTPATKIVKKRIRPSRSSTACVRRPNSHSGTDAFRLRGLGRTLKASAISATASANANAARTPAWLLLPEPAAATPMVTNSGASERLRSDEPGAEARTFSSVRRASPQASRRTRVRLAQPGDRKGRLESRREHLEARYASSATAHLPSSLSHALLAAGKALLGSYEASP